MIYMYTFHSQYHPTYPNQCIKSKTYWDNLCDIKDWIHSQPIDYKLAFVRGSVDRVMYADESDNEIVQVYPSFKQLSGKYSTYLKSSAFYIDVYRCDTDL